MMLAKFDPVGERRTWLDFGLKVETDFSPETIPREGHSHYVSLMTNSFAEAYLVGLADQVRPTIEKIITWMEAQPNQNRACSQTNGGTGVPDGMPCTRGEELLAFADG